MSERQNLRKQFSRRLGFLRKQRGMTQEELAVAAGLSVSFIRAIEQGVHAPSFESLDQLAFALGLEVQDLFRFQSD